MSPSSLHQTQQAAFQQALLANVNAPAGLFTSRGLAQFDVYRQAYRARLRAALRDNYALLPQVMGDEAFDALANAYTAAEPSRHFSIRWFGHRLVDFMRQQTELVPHPALADLAALEWALRQAFDAAQGADFDGAQLATLAPEEWPALRFAAQPAAQLLDLDWAVGPVWHALKEAEAAEVEAELEAPEALRHAVLVWRNGLHTQWKSLDAPEALFVRGLLAGEAFGSLCEALAAVVGADQAAAKAVATLRELIANGVLSGLTHAAPPTIHH